MARPTKYSPKILELTKQYIISAIDSYETVHYPSGISKDGKIQTNSKDVFKVRLPSIAGLALYLNTSRSNIYEWKEKNPEFSDILEIVLAEQEKRLMENGLSGTYNSNIVKLALGKHGYHDSVHTDVTSAGQPITASPEALKLTQEYEEKLKKGL